MCYLKRSLTTNRSRLNRRVCVFLQQGLEVSDREHWYGSEDFLALPAHLRKTEILAIKLESLAQSIPLVSLPSF